MEVRLSPDDEMDCGIAEVFDRLARRVIRLNSLCFRRNEHPTSDFISSLIINELRMIHSASVVMRVRRSEAVVYSQQHGLPCVDEDLVMKQPQLLALQLHQLAVEDGKKEPYEQDLQ